MSSTSGHHLRRGRILTALRDLGGRAPLHRIAFRAQLDRAVAASSLEHMHADKLVVREDQPATLRGEAHVASDERVWRLP